MQFHSSRLGISCWCRIAVIGFASAQAAELCAQTAQPPFGTQQQANDRIRSLSAAATTVSAPHDYIIGRGDLVSLEVFDVPELSRDLRVSQSGTIGVPLVPVRLYVAGLNEIQLQQKISEILEANGLVSHPQVMVSVKEKKSKPITIVGAVAHPMVYQADHAVTLIQVLAEAGGISADAGDNVIVTRADTTSEQFNSSEPPEIGPEDTVSAANPAAEAQPSSSAAVSSKNPPPDAPSPAPSPGATDATPPVINPNDAKVPLPNVITVNLAELLERGNTQNDIPLQAGDVVTIPHAGIVYALGAVQRPGGFVSNNDRAQLSTLKLLALAGGMTRIAKKDHAVIIRRDSVGKQISIPVDLGKIVQRKSEDIRMLPSDILYVPDSATKAALIRAGELGIAIGTALTVYRLGTGN